MDPGAKYESCARPAYFQFIAFMNGLDMIEYMQKRL